MTGSLVLHGGSELLAVHHEAAIAVPGDDDPLRIDGFGGDGGRHAIAHGTAGRRQLGAEAPVAVEAVQPGGVVAGAVGEDRIARQMLAEIAHHLAELHGPRGLGRLAVSKVVGMGGLGRLAPGGGIDRR